MNILPKKRWHVRTKDNIARVRRDEAQAAEEEKQRVLRAKLAEQEARTALLRTRAREKHDGDGRPDATQSKSSSTGPVTNTTKTQVADIYTAEGNINFFKDLEEGKQTHGKNEEYEKEKKEEQEKYERKIGYLTYLGQDSNEAQGKKAWYEEATGRTTYRGEEEEEEGGVKEVGLKSKDKLDPIHDIIKYGGIKPIKKVPGMPKPKGADEDVQIIQNQKVESHKLVQQNRSDAEKKRKYRHKERKKKKKSKKRKRTEDDDNDKEKRDRHKQRDRKRQRDDSSDEDNTSRKRRKSNSHKSKSRERERKRRRHHSSTTTTSSTSAYESSEDEEAIQEKKRKLDILRAERLKREAEERKRANRLLAGKKPDESDGPPKHPTIQQKYNSQFNPHIARQNQEQQPALEVGVKYWLQ